MKMIGIIPARYNSSRFPGKPLASLCGKPMIWWVYHQVKKVVALDEVYVATDDERIYDAVNEFGGKALMTAVTHSCGTDRLAECTHILELNSDDIILNIQGDEPLIRSEMIQDLIDTFDDEEVYMSTLKKRIDGSEDLSNPNVVKVIDDIHGNAIYFSRFPIPYERSEKGIVHYKHVGIYGYKVWFLLKYSGMARTPLECAESLEQLRAIENGYKIRVRETVYQTIGVDTPEQLKEVEMLMKEEIENV